MANLVESFVQLKNKKDIAFVLEFFCNIVFTPR